MNYEKVHTKDIIRLMSVSESTARKYIRLCRDATGLRRHQVLTLKKFMEYYGL
jgi:DeoR/GlpR family transcriptional regulator of sugar metabolism